MTVKWQGYTNVAKCGVKPKAMPPKREPVNPNPKRRNSRYVKMAATAQLTRLAGRAEPTGEIKSASAPYPSHPQPHRA